jgi:hypothetical protein
VREQKPSWRAAAFHSDDEIFLSLRLPSKKDSNITDFFIKLQSLFEDRITACRTLRKPVNFRVRRAVGSLYLRNKQLEP